MDHRKRLVLVFTLTAILAQGPALAQNDTGINAGQHATRGETNFTFFAIGDPQIDMEKSGTTGMQKMIGIMNKTPGKDFPFGGTVQKPKATLIAGDLVEDVKNPANWRRYTKLFDPRGDAMLKFPVLAGAGNHDLSGDVPNDFTAVEKAMIQQNRQSPINLNFGPNHYHYAWDWGRVHFVNLNIFPGNEPRPVYDNPAPWNNPKHSLRFLKQDLRQNVGDTGRPVILMWHYGLKGWGFDKWWVEEDLKNLKAALKDYNVKLILHGHEHAFRHYKWEGIDVIMAPAPQFGGDNSHNPKGFLVFRVKDGKLQMAHHTAEGWRERWQTSLAPTETTRN